jgi:energy-coupling factor transporter transmembrane protein EcfT
MFENLKKKWKVDNRQLILILCTFAVTGTLTAYISRGITSWVGFTDETFWGWKFLLRFCILLFGYQVIILIVSFFFGQFSFFWNYEKKILQWMGVMKKAKIESGKLVESSQSTVTSSQKQP